MLFDISAMPFFFRCAPHTPFSCFRAMLLLFDFRGATFADATPLIFADIFAFAD